MSRRPTAQPSRVQVFAAAFALMAGLTFMPLHAQAAEQGDLCLIPSDPADIGALAESAPASDSPAGATADSPASSSPGGTADEQQTEDASSETSQDAVADNATLDSTTPTSVSDGTASGDGNASSVNPHEATTGATEEPSADGAANEDVEPTTPTDDTGDSPAATDSEDNEDQQEPVVPSPVVVADDIDMEMSYNIRLAGTTRTVEVRRASSDNGADVWLYASDGTGKHQKVYLERDAQGFYTAWIVGTGKVLDLRGGSPIPGTNVFQWANAGTDNQKWAVRANSDGTYRLVNKATGLVLALDATGSTLVGALDDGSSACSFELVPVSLLSEGIYRIRPRTNTATSLDVSKASTGTASLILYKNTGALNQRYQLVSAGGLNLWYIRTGSSGGWIANTASGVVQTGNSSSNKGSASTWRVTFRGGWYCLINLHTGKALDMRGGSTTSGTQIIAYAPNGKDSQHFTLMASSLINEGTYYLQSAYGTRADIKGGSTSAGAAITTWSKKAATADLNQRFSITKAGAGYRIVNAKSGLVVSPSDLYRGYSHSGKVDSTYVTQRLASDMDYQLWVPQIADGGYIQLVNVASGRAMTALGSPAGSSIAIHEVLDTEKGQRWKLVATPKTTVAAVKKASTKVLMLGTSLTYYNDMPTLIVQQKKGVEAVSCTVGAAHLSSYTKANTSLGRAVRTALKNGCWDYVVIQAESSEAIDDYDTYLADLETLVSLARQAGAKPIILGTWAFTGGYNGTSKRYGSTSIEALEQFHNELQQAYARAAAEPSIVAANGGEPVPIANVGAAFAERSFDSSLYRDNKHASVKGSTLAAQVIAKLLK